MQIGGVNQSHSQVFLSDVWYCQLFPLDHSDILSDLFPATRSSLGMALPRLQPLYTQIEQNIYPVQFFENSPRLIPFSDSSRTHLWFLILYFQTLGFFYQTYYPYVSSYFPRYHELCTSSAFVLGIRCSEYTQHILYPQ